MTEDLVFKEKGFRRLNKEVEQKAHDLMKKIDHVVNTYSNNGCSVFNLKKNHVNVINEKIEYSRSITMQNEDNSCASIKRNSSLPYIFDQFTTLKSEVELQKNNEDEVFKKINLTNKTILNTFKAKIDVLQNELQTLQTEYKRKCDICKNVESENKRIEIKLKTEIESLKEKLVKFENVNKELQYESQALTLENSNLKKDLDKLQKQIKITNQQSNACVTRLNRFSENNDKLKNALKYCEIEEKELKTQIRQLQEDKRSTVNNLGKQLSELIQVFKRQMLIVDNLKRQNACLVAIGRLKFTKEDFSRLLDEKPENL